MNRLLFNLKIGIGNGLALAVANQLQDALGLPLFADDPDNPIPLVRGGNFQENQNNYNREHFILYQRIVDWYNLPNPPINQDHIHAMLYPDGFR